MHLITKLIKLIEGFVADQNGLVQVGGELTTNPTNERKERKMGMKPRRSASMAEWQSQTTYISLSSLFSMYVCLIFCARPCPEEPVGR